MIGLLVNNNAQIVPPHPPQSIITIYYNKQTKGYTMNKNIEELQRFSNKLRFIIDELAEDLLDDTPNGTERIINKASHYINGICRLAEVVEDYVPKEEGCRCGELKEILELIPKKLSLGEFLELKDLIHQHFKGG
jgi:hypothetical protein